MPLLVSMFSFSSYAIASLQWYRITQRLKCHYVPTLSQLSLFRRQRMESSFKMPPATSDVCARRKYFFIPRQTIGNGIQVRKQNGRRLGYAQWNCGVCEAQKRKYIFDTPQDGSQIHLRVRYQTWGSSNLIPINFHILVHPRRCLLSCHKLSYTSCLET